MTKLASTKPGARVLARALRIARVWVAVLPVATAPTGANSMVTASQFAVSESGAATLTVPIQVPRGIGGMEPQLALNYSSASGNGLLGLGWMLSGPSAITRCPKNRVVDGFRGAVTFGTGDRYCLDGQRLEIVSAPNDDASYGAPGSVYRTERDTFSRITANGQYEAQPNVPNSFKVETKAGLILDFGLSANSQVKTNRPSGLGPTTINRWMLQRISDRHGSFVEFVYCGGEVSSTGSTCTSTEGTANWSGSKVLHYVRYTNRAGALNGEFAIVFGYEGRPDRVQGFHAGSASRQTQRLALIQTYHDFAGPASPGTPVRGYVITYKPHEDAAFKGIRATNTSRIERIQERDKDGNTLPPLTFTLASDEVFGNVVTHRPAATVGVPAPGLSCGGVIANRLSLMCR